MPGEPLMISKMPIRINWIRISKGLKEIGNWTQHEVELWEAGFHDSVDSDSGQNSCCWIIIQIYTAFPLAGSWFSLVHFVDIRNFFILQWSSGRMVTLHKSLAGAWSNFPRVIQVLGNKYAFLTTNKCGLEGPCAPKTNKLSKNFFAEKMDSRGSWGPSHVCITFPFRLNSCGAQPVADHQDTRAHPGMRPDVHNLTTSSRGCFFRQVPQKNWEAATHLHGTNPSSPSHQPTLDQYNQPEI